VTDRGRRTSGNVDAASGRATCASPSRTVHRRHGRDGGSATRKDEDEMRRTTGTRGLGRWSLAGAALMMAAALTGCGSDGNSGGSADAEASDTAAAADPAAFCEASVDAEAAIAMGPPIDFETASPEEIQTVLQEFGAQIEPTLAEAEDTAPDEVRDDVTTLTGLIRQVVETGDDTVFEQPEYTGADAAIDEYMLAECGYEHIEATGVDYEYEGIPATVPAGVVAMTFTNEGKETHEIGVARLNDGVTQSVEEILALPPDQSETMFTFAGAAFAEPGGSDTVFLRMEEAGRYGAACFVPQGTTHDTEGSGPPHFTLGMFAEFSVE
jgi:hypothetical protein